MTSTAAVNVSSVGVFFLSLRNQQFLEEFFGSFSIGVSGLGSNPVVLNFEQESQPVNVSAGVHDLTKWSNSPSDQISAAR